MATRQRGFRGGWQSFQRVSRVVHFIVLWSDVDASCDNWLTDTAAISDAALIAIPFASLTRFRWHSLRLTMFSRDGVTRISLRNKVHFLEFSITPPVRLAVVARAAVMN